MIKLFDLGNDWYAAETMEEAIAAFRADMKANLGYSDEDIDGEGLIFDPQEETVMDAPFWDGEIEAETTFGLHLQRLIEKGQEFPCYFGSRDW